MNAYDEKKLKPCPACGGTNLDTSGGMFLEYYGHEHVAQSVECVNCGFDVDVDASNDFPCSCCHYDEMTIELIRKWNEHPGREEARQCN